MWVSMDDNLKKWLVTFRKNSKVIYEKMGGDFSGIQNLVGDRSPMTAMVAKCMV